MNLLDLISSHRPTRVLFACAALATLAVAGRATTIVDTGTPNDSIQWSFTNGQYFGGQFTIGSATTITDVQGYFDNSYGSSDGFVTIALHSDAGTNTPGSVLYSDSIALAGGSTLDWYGLSGLNWSVGAGTYWVSFMPDGNISGTMPGIAPSLLDVYAQGYGTYNWYGAGPDSFDYLKIGIRVESNSSNVPDGSSTVMLVGSVMLGFAAMRRRFRR